jgi:predicted RNase H-like HicB family nuclease
MSDKSKKSRQKIDAPFSPEILRRAKALVDRYQIVVSVEDGEYYGRGLELPFVMDDGATPQACIANARKALVATVATMLEQGQVPPSPASDEKRDQQINIRLSAMEKAALEESARQAGYSGVSEFVRAAALGQRPGTTLMPHKTMRGPRKTPDGSRATQ